MMFGPQRIRSRAPHAQPKPPSAKPAKPAARRAEARQERRASEGRAELGALPEWNLADLYPAMDAPELKRDLERADADCVAFEEAYKGKLAALAAGADGGAKLAEAVKRYEALDDLLGRLISYAGLVYAGNTTDPVRAKFYGDMQERITAASLHLLFFTLELNRIDDAALDERDGAIRRSATTGRGSRTSARRSRISSRTGSRSCSTRSR